MKNFISCDQLILLLHACIYYYINKENNVIKEKQILLKSNLLKGILSYVRCTIDSNNFRIYPLIIYNETNEISIKRIAEIPAAEKKHKKNECQ